MESNRLFEVSENKRKGKFFVFSTESSFKAKVFSKEAFGLLDPQVIEATLRKSPVILLDDFGYHELIFIPLSVGGLKFEREIFDVGVVGKLVDSNNI